MAKWTNSCGAVIVLAVFLSLAVIVAHGVPLEEKNLLQDPAGRDSQIDTDSLNVREKRGLFGLPDVTNLNSAPLDSVVGGIAPSARSKAKSQNPVDQLTEKAEKNSAGVKKIVVDNMAVAPDASTVGANAKQAVDQSTGDTKSLAKSDTSQGAVPVLKGTPAVALPDTPDLPKAEVPSVPKNSELTKSAEGVNLPKAPAVQDVPVSVPVPAAQDLSAVNQEPTSIVKSKLETKPEDQVSQIKANAVDLKPSPGDAPPPRTASDIFSALIPGGGGTSETESEAEPAAEEESDGAAEEEADEEPEEETEAEDEEPASEEPEEEEDPEPEEDEEEETADEESEADEDDEEEEESEPEPEEDEDEPEEDDK